MLRARVLCAVTTGACYLLFPCRRLHGQWREQTQPQNVSTLSLGPLRTGSICRTGLQCTSGRALNNNGGPSRCCSTSTRCQRCTPAKLHSIDSGPADCYAGGNTGPLLARTYPWERSSRLSGACLEPTRVAECDFLALPASPRDCCCYQHADLPSNTQLPCTRNQRCGTHAGQGLCRLTHRRRRGPEPGGTLRHTHQPHCPSLLCDVSQATIATLAAVVYQILCVFFFRSSVHVLRAGRPAGVPPRPRDRAQRIAAEWSGGACQTVWMYCRCEGTAVSGVWGVSRAGAGEGWRATSMERRARRSMRAHASRCSSSTLYPTRSSTSASAADITTSRRLPRLPRGPRLLTNLLVAGAIICTAGGARDWGWVPGMVRNACAPCIYAWSPLNEPAVSKVGQRQQICGRLALHGRAVEATQQPITRADSPAVWNLPIKGIVLTSCCAARGAAKGVIQRPHRGHRSVDLRCPLACSHLFWRA